MFELLNIEIFFWLYLRRQQMTPMPGCAGLQRVNASAFTIHAELPRGAWSSALDYLI